MKKIIITLSSLFFMFFLFGEQIYKNDVIISYYAEDFHGKKTSNGEFFNMNDFTCAHKTLPFNTILKIKNLKNGKSVQVRVNDRGPFVVGREADVSKAAAIKLDMIKSGTCRAKLEIVKLGENTKLSNQTALSAAKIMEKKGEKISTQIPDLKSEKKNQILEEKSLYDIQIGAYSTREAANQVAQKLLKQGFSDVVFQKTNTVIRVCIRKIPGEKIPELEERLIQNGYHDFVVKKRKS